MRRKHLRLWKGGPRQVLTLCLLICCVMLADGTAWAGSTCWPCLQRILERPVICAGSAGPVMRIVPPDEAGSPVEWHVVRFVPDHVLKGTLPGAEIEIRYMVYIGHLKTGISEYPSVPDKGRALLFLEEPDGHDPAYVLPQDYSSCVQLSPARPAFGEDAQLDVVSGIQAELLASLRYRGEGEADYWLTAVRALGVYGIPNEDILRQLGVLSQSALPPVRLSTLAARVLFGHHDVLPDMFLTLEDWDGPLSIRSFAVVGAALSVLRGDPECLPVLEAFLQSAAMPDWIRYSAADAVEHMSDDRVVPILMGFLSDRDAHIQLTAIHALYRIEKTDTDFELPASDCAPDRERFQANPDKYLNNWRQWWATTGRLKYAHVLNAD